MDNEPKLSPFAMTPARIMLLVLGALLVVITISTSLGGINAYQQLKEAATSTPAVDTAVE
jgi:hypothetical protein